MKYVFMSALLLSLLTGCMNSTDSETVTETSSTSEFVSVLSGSGGTINYCRPNSIMRSVETVEIYTDGDLNKLNGQLSAKIKNGGSGSIPINLKQNFTFGLKQSLLFMRNSDQIVFSDLAMTKKDRYFIVKGNPNYSQGFAVLTAGYIGAAALDKTQDTGKANWDVLSVTRAEFMSSCK
ncbi:hypothetical protein N9O45_02890 [Planktomarina temperata]|nr:hypothetical protein [Planktomarina temperata]